jgi:hypothetical protein
MKGDRIPWQIDQIQRQQLYIPMSFKQWLFEKVANIDNEDGVLKIVNHTKKQYERFMALIRARKDKIYLRCVLSKMDSTGGFPNSYLCEGRLIGNTIHVEKILLSPETRPRTERGEKVVGYEDPSLFDGVLFVTEVYKSRNKKILTNLVSYNLKTKETKTVLRPEKAKHDLGLDHADMVKEAHVFDLGGKPHMLLEVGGTVAEGGGYSQIAIAGYSGNKLGKIMPFLHPIPKTWLSEHTSTVCSPIKLGDNYVFVFNGRDDMKWAVGFGLLNPLGHLYYLTPKPIIESPITPGWGGQKISFASDVTKKGNKFEILYHRNDESICRTTFEAKDFCSST